MSEEQEPEDRQTEVWNVVVKFIGAVVVIGIAIFIVAKILVSQLDLNSADGPVGGSAAPTSIAPLPTSAITTSPTEPAHTPTEEPSDDPTDLPTDPTDLPSDSEIELSASPVFVGPMGKINLEGGWPGHDNESLSVQRFEGGEWVDFGVQVQVKVGTYKTYVQTSHEGVNRFRMYDAQTDTASNEVSVTIGS